MMQRSEFDQWRSSDVARLLALVETERRYFQDIFAALPVPLAILDANQNLMSVNREFRKRFGRSGLDLNRARLTDLFQVGDLGSPVVEALHPASERMFRLNVQKMRGWQDSGEEELLLTVEEPAAAERSDLPWRTWEQNSAADDVHPVDREAYLEFNRQGTTARSVDYRVLETSGRVRWQRDVATAWKDGRRSGLTIDVTQERREGDYRAETAKREGTERLSGRLAHAANNLLMIIGGYAEDLREGLPEGDERIANIEEILKASERLAKLTQQLNAVAHPAAVEVGELDLAAWAKQALPGLREAVWPLCPVEVESASVTAVGNAALLDQIVLEAARLLRPSLVATNRLTIRVSAAGPTATVTLRLSGPNPDAEVWATLLEPFAGPKQSGIDPPLGIAALVRPLEEAGGSLRKQGEPGEPMEMIIRLPRSGAAEVEPEEVTSTPVLPPAPPPAVLVVEDEPGIRALVRKALRRNGYEVIDAGEPAEALKLASERAGAIDLLVTDLTMPGGTGQKLAGELRAARPGIRVLFISGYSEDATIEEQAAAGTLPAGTAFLKKPFALGRFIEQVREILAE